MSNPDVKGIGGIILGSNVHITPQEHIQMLLRDNSKLQAKVDSYRQANEELYREVQDLQMLLAISAYQNGGMLTINPEFMENVNDHEIIIMQDDAEMIQVTLTQLGEADLDGTTEPTLFS